jgi:hypothetical protein
MNTIFMWDDTIPEKESSALPDLPDNSDCLLLREGDILDVDHEVTKGTEEEKGLYTMETKVVKSRICLHINDNETTQWVYLKSIPEDKNKTKSIFPSENEHTRILGTLLHGVLIADGALSEESNPTYPELVLFAEEYLKSKEKKE